MEKVWMAITGDVLEAEAGSNDHMEAIVFGGFLQLLERVPDHTQTGWVPVGGGRVAWAVLLGSVSEKDLPYGADAPMRNAVALAWQSVMPGVGYQYLRSGWWPVGADQVRDSAKEWFGVTSAFA